MLLTISEISQRLDEKFLPLEPLVRGFRLTLASFSPDIFSESESVFGMCFPPIFKELAIQYDLGHFTLGPTAFCSKGNYISCILNYNAPNDFPWWGTGKKPRELFMIANSEFGAIILNATNETIMTFPHGTLWQSHLHQIAEDFRKFVSGIGTVFFDRMNTNDRIRLAAEVAEEVGGKAGIKFWNDLAK